MADRIETTGNDEQNRNITVNGPAERSVFVTGNGNVIHIGGMPVDLPDVDPAFHVLMITARPLDIPELSNITDGWSLADGLRAIEAPVKISFLRPPTRRHLELTLENGWDVLHFDGHGSTGAGDSLLFETEDGLRQSISVDDFVAQLKQIAQPPKLVILSACQSAKGDSGGLAGRLTREVGIPAVIGFREPVPIDLTIAFVAHLYTALGAGRTIVNSFNNARDFLETSCKVELPLENEGQAPRTMAARDFPTLAGSGTDQTLCEMGRHGPALVENEPLVGVPAPSESGRFYGIFRAGDPPTGRYGLLVCVTRALLRGEKMVVLTGQGGIGKSALAAVIARRLAWRYPGGVFWVDGGSYQQSGLHLDDALDVFAACFGDDFLKANTTRKHQAVLAYLEQINKPCLWIIDNADVAEDEVWQVARQVGGHSAVLLTSRERPEYGSNLLDVEGIAIEEALPFLVQEVRRRKNDPIWGLVLSMDNLSARGLNETQTRQLREIARLVDGHALALLHAAALIADEGLSQAEKLVQANPARGEVTRRFDFSYARLTFIETTLLQRLSAFAADFDLDAVDAVCMVALDEQDPGLLPDWGDALRGLARKSFVEVVRWNEDYRRYRLHPVLREYVRAKATESLARDEWHMASFYLKMADAACNLLSQIGKARAAVALAERERLNLLAAQQICLNQGREAAVILFAYRLDTLFERSGLLDARRRALECGLK